MTIQKGHLRAILDGASREFDRIRKLLEPQEWVSLHQLGDLAGDELDRALGSPAVHRAVVKILAAPEIVGQLDADTLRAWQEFAATKPADLGPLPPAARNSDEERARVRLAVAEAHATGKKSRRPYQNRTISAIAENTRTGKRHHLVVHPTGTGKTYTSAELYSDMRAEGLIHKRTIVLTHRVEILDQLRGAFAAVAGDEHVTVVSAGRDSYDFTGDVVIAGVQTLYPRLGELNPDDYDTIFSDEAHHLAPGKRWAKILARMGVLDETGRARMASPANHIGMTATPIRADRMPLAIPFTPDAIDPETNYSIEDAIEEGYILKPRGVLVLAKELNLDKAAGDRDGDYDQGRLTEAVENEPFHRTVVQAYLDHGNGGRALAFTASVGQTIALAEYFNAAGVRAAAIHDRLSKDERQRIIAAHKKGEIDVICNFGILTEGYDDPGIKVILMARPTKSLGLYLQMLGRGFRIDPDDPATDNFLVIDFCGVASLHDAQVNLARIFAIEYEHFDRPDMDPVRKKREFKKILDLVGEGTEAQIRARIIKLQADGALAEVSYELIDIIKTILDPLPRRLNEILLARYNGDQLAMGFALQMSGPRLRSYMGQDYPEKENEVWRDFAHASQALGIETKEVVRLWRQSQRFLRFQIIVGEFERNANVVGIPERSPERLAEFCRKLEGEFAGTTSEETVTIEKIADLVGWARAHRHDVSTVDAIVARIDPHYSPAWAASLEDEIAVLMRVEHPTTDQQLWRSLTREGRPLAVYIPHGVEDLKGLITAIEQRFYPTENIRRLTAGLRRVGALPIPAREELPEFSLLKSVTERLRGLPRGTTMGGEKLQDALCRILRDGGYAIPKFHPLADGGTRARYWLANALASYPESVGREIFELCRSYERMGLSLLHPNFRDIDIRLGSAINGFMFGMDWMSPDKFSFEQKLPAIQKEADANLRLTGIPAGGAFFSAKIRTQTMLERNFVEWVTANLVYTRGFPKRPSETEEALAGHIGITTDIVERWAKVLSEAGLQSPISIGAINDLCYAYFTNAAARAVHGPGFDRTRLALEMCVASALKIALEDVGPWIEYFRKSGTSAKTARPIGGNPTPTSLDLILATVTDSDRTAAHLAAMEQSAPAIAFQPFPIEIGYAQVTEQDRRLWDVTLRAEAIARAWHGANPIAGLNEFDVHLTTSGIDLGVLGQVVDYFGGRTREFQRRSQKDFNKYVAAPVRLAMTFIARLQDWHANNERTIALLLKLAGEADILLGMKAETKRLTDEARHPLIREHVARQLAFRDDTFICNRVVEFSTMGLPVGNLVQIFPVMPMPILPVVI